MSMEGLSTAHDGRMKAKNGDNPGIPGNFVILGVNAYPNCFQGSQEPARHS
jgi:hypothetical protein